MSRSYKIASSVVRLGRDKKFLTSIVHRAVAWGCYEVDDIPYMPQSAYFLGILAYNIITAGH